MLGSSAFLVMASCPGPTSVVFRFRKTRLIATTSLAPLTMAPKKMSARDKSKQLTQKAALLDVAADRELITQLLDVNPECIRHIKTHLQALNYLTENGEIPEAMVDTERGETLRSGRVPVQPTNGRLPSTSCSKCQCPSLARRPAWSSSSACCSNSSRCRFPRTP